MARWPKDGKHVGVASTDHFEARTLIPELNEAGFQPGDIEVVGAAEALDKIAVEKFMNEKIIIEIEEDDKPNSPTFVYLGHNGIGQYVHRGQEQTVKRKFMYSALMAKAVKVNVTYGKDGSGMEFNNNKLSTSTTHRCRLVRDDNPQGGAKWVRAVMQESAMQVS